MKSKVLLFGLLVAFVTFSCSKNEGPTTDNSTITAEEAGINARVDATNDDVSKIAEDQLNTNEGFAGKSAAVINPFLPACATITRVPATPNVGQTVTKTISFDPSGCTMPNGNILKGKLIFTFIYDPNATTHTVTCTFDNFYHNARKIEGTKTFTRTMTLATATSASHPIWVMTMNLTITLPDGRVLTRVGTRTSEVIAGYNTPADWTDNVYSVTGNWTTTFPNAATQTSTITSPIIVKLACIPTNSALSKGIITFVRNTRTATLDYGNGDCDNQAIFTINGISYPIILGN